VRENCPVMPPDSQPVPPGFPEIVSAALRGWVAVTPQPSAAADLHALLQRHEVAALGRGSTTRAAVDADVSATGTLTRRHLLLRDEAARARAWATVLDRAAGRVVVSVVVDPDLETGTADTIAGAHAAAPTSHATAAWTSPRWTVAPSPTTRASNAGSREPDSPTPGRGSR
jgi:hypothetical protein